MTSPATSPKHDALLAYVEAKTVASNYWRTERGSWSALLGRLAVPVRTPETFEQFMALDRDTQGKLKDVGAWCGATLINGKAGRGKRNVAARTFATLDFDRVKDATEFEAAVRGLGFAVAVHSTRKHCPDAPRFRVVVPFSGPVGVDEWDAVARIVAQRIDPTLEGVDPGASFGAASAMHFPSCSSDGEFIFYAVDGPILDVEQLLDASGVEWRDAAALPRAPSESLSRSDLHARAGDPLSKPGVIGAFNRAYLIGEAISKFIPGVYAPGTEGRFSYLAGESKNGLVTYENGTLAYSFHSTDPAHGHARNAFDLVRLHRFGELDATSHGNTSPTKLPSYAAMLDMIRQDEPTIAAAIGIERQDAAELFEPLAADDDDPLALFSPIGGSGGSAPPPPSTGGSGAAPAGGGNPRAWLTGLTFTPNGVIETTLPNLVRILTHHPDVAGTFAWNEFSARVVIRRLGPWALPSEKRPGRDGAGLTDADVVAMRVWLEDRVGLRRVSQTLAFEAVAAVARAHPFHPVREYLGGLVWDGVERVETLLVRHLGAADTPYVRAVTRKFMLGAVARVMRPGCKFDSILLLRGAQGLGKSRFAMRLANGWGAEGLGNLDNKDALEGILGKWIVEVAELSGFKRQENERIKAFLSTQADTYRRPYERSAVTLPRQCVFIGTTNSVAPLRDSTGGRRFWIVECGRTPIAIDNEIDAAEVEQLWAETVTRYACEPEPLWLEDADVAAAAAEVQADHTINATDELREAIEEFLDAPVPADFYNRAPAARLDWIRNVAMRPAGETLGLRNIVTPEEVWVEMQGGDPKHLSAAHREAIVEAVLSLPEWQRSGRARVRGVRRRVMFNPRRPALVNVSV